MSPKNDRIRRPHKGPKRDLSEKDIAKTINDLKGMGSPQVNYRERSLAIHGMICAKCAREFSEEDRHQLTVHHKDGNDANNPPDGSNWENLCIYCHEDEHSRGRLGDYLRGDD